MKNFLLTAILLCVSSVTFADQRFETVGGFCHFVTPEGFQNTNDDNEVFFANCLNSIRQNADGTGSGSTLIKVNYQAGAAPFSESFSTSGAETGVNCVMVDSNGTQYVTQDWDSTYKVDGDDDDDDDDKKKNSNKKIKIKYSLICRNGAQQ